MKILATSSLMLAALVAAGACSSSSGGTGSGGRGSGGATASGGSGTNTGGARSGGAGGGAVGGSAGPAVAFAYTFDTTVQGFSFNTFQPTTGPQVNLAVREAGTPPTIGWDSANGDPNPGALKVTATYDNYSQSVDAIVGPLPSLDLTGKTIHARVMLMSGTFSGTASLHVSSTAMYYYAGSSNVSLTAGTWTTLDLLIPTTGAMWNSTDIRQVGIQLISNGAPEAGTFGAPQDVVVLIDTITDGTGAITSNTPRHAFTFDTTVQGWSYNTFQAASGTPRNLAVAAGGASGAGGAGGAGASVATLEFDGTDGNPANGSLKASMTFTDYEQQVDAIVGPFPAYNLMGRTLHAKIKLTSGSFPSGSGVVLHAGTTAMYLYGGGAYTALPTVGTWTDLTLDLSTVTTAMWDPTQVVQIGIQISSGSRPEAGAYPGPNPVVFNIDTVTD